MIIKLSNKLIIILTITLLSLLLFRTKSSASTTIDFHIAVFGDSNSAGFSTIQPWVQKLAPTLNPNTKKLNFIVTNYSLGGKTMSNGANSYRNSVNFQSFITDTTKKADLAIVMLGTNDALGQVSLATYSSDYVTFLKTLHDSGRVSNVLAVSTPLMKTPYNCAGSGCPVYTSTNNPNINWINKYNTYLANNVATVCNNFNTANRISRFPMSCTYLNVTSSIPATNSYLLASDGVHLLNNAQQIVANLVKNRISTYSLKFIINLPINITAINIDTNDGLKSGQFGGYSRFMNTRVSRDGKPLVETQIDLRRNLDWVGISGNVDFVNSKSFIIKLNSATPGVNSNYSLFVPKKANDNKIHVCPAAASLTAITLTCANGYSLTPDLSTVNTTNINGVDYWKITGLAKPVGAMSYAGTSYAWNNTTSVIEGITGDEFILRDSVVDTAGNKYIIGKNLGTIDLDVKSGVSGYTDNSVNGNLFFAKYDASNNLQWYRALETTSGSSTSSPRNSYIYVKNDEVLIASFINLNGTVDIDGTAGAEIYNVTTSGAAILLSKYDTNGNYLLSKTIQPKVTAADLITNIWMDNSGNIYFSGQMSNAGGSVDFDPGVGIYNLTASSGSEPYLASLDTNGNFRWAFRMGNASLNSEGALDMTGTDAGYIFLSGYFPSVVDINPSSVVTNVSKAFVAQYDLSGNYVDSVVYTADIRPRKILLDQYPSFYVLGTAISNVAIDYNPFTSVDSLSGGKTFISKFTDINTYEWTKLTAGTSLTNNTNNDIVTGVLDSAGNVYMASSFTGTVDFDPTVGTDILSSVGGFDLYIRAYDSAGNALMSDTIQGLSGSESIHGLFVDVLGNLELLGHSGVNGKLGSNTITSNSQTLSNPTINAPIGFFMKFSH